MENILTFKTNFMSLKIECLINICKKLKEHVAIIGITLIAISLSCILCNKVSTANESLYDKSFISIEIEAGDTLWDIARDYAPSEYISYDNYIEEVISINHISAYSLKEGNYLLIPCYSKH